VREYEFNGAQPLALLPAPLTSTDHVLAHVHTVFWQTAKIYVQQGGALYASLCADAAIPEMEELFGARLADHAPVSEVTITLQRAFGDLQPGETFTFHPAGSGYAQWPAVIELAGAEVIAVDQDGRPALVCYENGKGKTLLCTYPIEVYLAQEPGAFDRPNPAYRLYRALAQWAGVQPKVDSGHPAVEVGRIENDARGYAVFTNHSAQAVDLTARVALDGARAALLLPQGPQALQGQTDTWKVTVPAWDGVIVEWKK
jgi:hypothetical protein